MNDPMNTELTELFEATREVPGPFAAARMVARAAATPRRSAGRIPQRFVWGLGSLAALSLLVLFTVRPHVTSGEGARGAVRPGEIDVVYGTYLDVGWDGALVGDDPLDGLHADLATDEILDAYELLFEGPIDDI